LVPTSALKLLRDQTSCTFRCQKYFFKHIQMKVDHCFQLVELFIAGDIGRCGVEERRSFMRACLTRDWERLVSFFDYPQEHWIHLRTTNIVESPFEAVRLRTNASRRFKKTDNAEAMRR